MQTTTSIRNLVGLIGWKTTCKAAHKGRKKNQRELFCLLSTATKILQGYRVGTGMYPQNKNLGVEGQQGMQGTSWGWSWSLAQLLLGAASSARKCPRITPPISVWAQGSTCPQQCPVAALSSLSKPGPPQTQCSCIFQHFSCKFNPVVSQKPSHHLQLSEKQALILFHIHEFPSQIHRWTYKNI